jgi:hypothetical protein
MHDGEELVHNYHTFALDIGIFTKNSINDLLYFTNQMVRGLGIPSSYLPTGAEDGQALYSDGKTGTAYIQEYAFSKVCQRLQNLMAPVLDREFKLFVKHRGIDISAAQFELQFWPPQSFAQSRQIQLDTDQINVFSSLMNTDANKYISKRFALERYLGWTPDEILRNEMMFKEENPSKVKSTTGQDPSGGGGGGIGLSGVGVSPQNMAPMPDEGGEGSAEMTDNNEGPAGGDIAQNASNPATSDAGGSPGGAGGGGLGV